MVTSEPVRDICFWC